MKKIVHLVNISKKPLHRAAARLMTDIFTVSRLLYRPDLLALKTTCPLPEIPHHFTDSFEEIAMARGQNIWSKYSSQDSIDVLWSGGIDSTVALTALILTRPFHGKINVYCNLNSVSENEHFYRLLLRYKFIELKNSSLIQGTEKRFIVTGELGDQIFGSDFIFSIANAFGTEAIHRPYEDVLPKLFKARVGDKDGSMLYERYSPICHEAPFPIKSAFDFVWWWNFTQKWQSIKYHQKSLLPPLFEPLHFFENTHFQLWSYFNHEKKIGKTLESYKLPSKEFIFTLDRNYEYLMNKKKISSPLGNHRYFYVLFEDGSVIDNYKESSELIDKLSTAS